MCLFAGFDFMRIAQPTLTLTRRTHILIFANMSLFWLLGFELLVKSTVRTLSQELWMNAVVRPPCIIMLMLWGWTGCLWTSHTSGLDLQR